MEIARTTMALVAAAGLCLATGASAAASPMSAPPAMSKEARDQAIRSAGDRYKADQDACKSLSGNAKDVCVEEAKGKEKIAKAEAEAAYENTPKARENARLAHAQAEYDVATEKCDDLAGNRKDVCRKVAEANYTKAKADAKVDRVAADASDDAMKKTADAKRDAAEDKRDADYKVAHEKCDSLAGSAKDACVRDARAKYGKS